MRNSIVIILAIAIIGVAGYLWQDVLSAEESDKQAQINLALTEPITNEQSEAFIQPVVDSNYNPVRDFTIEEPILDARAAIVYDRGSDRFLYAHNPTEKLPIASITKLMTAVIIIETMNLNDIYTVQKEDLNQSGLGTKLYAGEKIVGHDLLKLMLVESNNDAATVFARTAGLHDIDFLDQMNQKATELGMFDTHFADPAGLDDVNTYSTASDLVSLVNYVDRHPVIWDILITPSDEISTIDGVVQHHLENTNKLLGQIRGIIGGKTGLTDVALGTLALVVEMNEDQDIVVAIVLGSNNRFETMEQLLDWTRKAHTWR
jgi:serine-type D-Ala-D-Ala carboxypeptidase (penicillin-binding protein 5/6)